MQIIRMKTVCRKMIRLCTLQKNISNNFNSDVHEETWTIFFVEIELHDNPTISVSVCIVHFIVALFTSFMKFERKSELYIYE